MPRFPLAAAFLLIAALMLPGLRAAPAMAAGPDVVASIKPVASLVAAVMQGAGQPHLIVAGGASPHGASLKPSDAAALQKAQVVVWVGPGLESFLAAPIATLAGKARVVELAEAPGLTRLPYRSGGAWEPDADEAEEHGGTDMHLWLDPQNARAMVAAIADALAAADPANAALYRSNAAMTEARLDALAQEIAAELAPVKAVPFVVFHDAFQYLDTRFGLANVGAITVDPEQKPGAARLREIRARIAELGARCVFAEPQFEPRLVPVVIEGTGARAATLDPLGADIPDGPELYFTLLRNNARALVNCLGGTS